MRLTWRPLSKNPMLKLRERYFASGDYFWNSGMFAFKAGRFLRELEKFNPEMLEVCKRSVSSREKRYGFCQAG